MFAMLKKLFAKKEKVVPFNAVLLTTPLTSSASSPKGTTTTRTSTVKQDQKQQVDQRTVYVEDTSSSDLLLGVALSQSYGSNSSVNSYHSEQTKPTTSVDSASTFSSSTTFRDDSSSFSSISSFTDSSSSFSSFCDSGSSSCD